MHESTLGSVHTTGNLSTLDLPKVGHICVSEITMAGQNQRTVQELMGHKTPAMTARYSHLSPEHLKTAVHSFDEAQHSYRQ